jgi:hypothetical protein
VTKAELEAEIAALRRHLVELRRRADLMAMVSHNLLEAGKHHNAAIGHLLELDRPVELRGEM